MKGPKALATKAGRAYLEQLTFIKEHGGDLAGYLDNYRGTGYTYDEIEKIFEADVTKLHELAKNVK